MRTELLLKVAFPRVNAGIAQLVEQLICNCLTTFCSVFRDVAHFVFQRTRLATRFARCFAESRRFSAKICSAVENYRESCCKYLARLTQYNFFRERLFWARKTGSFGVC